MLSKIMGYIIFQLPHYGILAASKIACQKKSIIYNRFPFNHFAIPHVLPDGNKFFCSIDAYTIMAGTYYNDDYNRFFKPEANNVVVDAGAHVGFYTVKTAKQVGSKGLVIAIEPEERNFHFLQKNIQVNNFQNVIPIKSALADFERKADFYLKSRSFSHSLLKEIETDPTVSSTQVHVTTLDRVIAKFNIKRIDILKMNVEGMELQALKGAKQSLRKGKISNIILTTHPPFKQSAKKIMEHLRSMEYKTRTNADFHIVYASFT